MNATLETKIKKSFQFTFTEKKKRNTIKLHAFIIIFFSYHESYRNFNYQEDPESRLTNKFPHDGTNIFQFFFSLLFFFFGSFRDRNEKSRSDLKMFEN